MSRHSRRDVVKLAAASAVVPWFIPQSVFASSPAETVRVGIIGCGGRARSIVRESAEIPGMKIVAVCDCFKPAVDRFVQDVGKDKGWATYEDFRKMIEEQKLDGVMIETTTHARSWIAVNAMQMGVDTYIEKPMCLTIKEGRHMVNAARKYGTVTQVGTQQRSMPINNWASDLVKNGAIGKVLKVLAPNFVGPERWPNKPEMPMPDGGSKGWWDVWTNQAELRPYHPELHHGWERWWAYDGGGLCFGVTGWGTHSYDQIQRALGTDETGPVEIVLEEPVQVAGCGKFENIPDDDPTYLEYLHRLAKPVVGPRAKVRMKYANGTELLLHLDGDWGPGLGAIFVGEQGKIEINRNKIAANPKELIDSPDNPGPNKRPETEYHIANWIDCIRTRKRCNADIEFGLRSTTLCYLVNIVRELGEVGKPLRWDPETETFPENAAANHSSYMERERRKGYELPSLA